MNPLRRFFAWILLASCSMLGFAQISTVAIDRDIRMLERIGASSGLDSKEYNDKLLDLSFQYADTCYHAHYAYFANAIIDNNDNLRKVYGIDSMEYRQAMINLTNFFLFGNYVDDHYDQYEERAVAVLLGLENLLKQVSSNKEQFLAILRVVYKHHFNDAKKALAYSKKGLEIAEKNKVHDPTNYAYVLASYIQDLTGQYETGEANQEIAKLAEELAIHLNNFMEDGVSFAEVDKVNVVELYLEAGIYVGQLGGDIKLAADCMTKAITLAESIGRNDLCYYTVDQTCHHWTWVSMWYAQLGQHEKAIEAQEKAVDATMRDYGLKSQEWVDAAKCLSALYDGRGDYEKALQTCRKLLNVIGEMSGRMSADYLEQLLLTVGAYRSCKSTTEALVLLLSIDPEKIPDMTFLFRYYNMRGLCYSDTKEYDRARDCFEKAAMHSTTDADRVTAMSNKILILDDMGLYEQQVEELEELLRFAKRSRTIEPHDMYDLYEQLGMAWSEVDEAKAMRYFDEAERYYSDSDKDFFRPMT